MDLKWLTFTRTALMMGAMAFSFQIRADQIRPIRYINKAFFRDLSHLSNVKPFLRQLNSKNPSLKSQVAHSFNNIVNEAKLGNSYTLNKHVENERHRSVTR